jgi:hypothetical protein
MENTSGLKLRQGSVKVFIGEESKEIEFPGGKKFRLHALNLADIAKLENFCGVDFADWADKNPFAKLSVIQHTLWLSLKKNPNIGMTEEDLAANFGIPDLPALGQIIEVILHLSGLEAQAKEEGKE